MAKKKGKKAKKQMESLRELKQTIGGISYSEKDIDFQNDDELSHAISFLTEDDEPEEETKGKKKNKKKSKVALLPWDEIESKEEREEWDAISAGIKADKDYTEELSAAEENILSLKKARKSMSKYKYNDIFKYKPASILDKKSKDEDDEPMVDSLIDIYHEDVA